MPSGRLEQAYQFASRDEVPLQCCLNRRRRGTRIQGEHGIGGEDLEVTFAAGPLLLAAIAERIKVCTLLTALSRHEPRHELRRVLPRKADRVGEAAAGPMRSRVATC